jgi:hypothetical protein
LPKKTISGRGINADKSCIFNRRLSAFIGGQPFFRSLPPSPESRSAAAARF